MLDNATQRQDTTAPAPVSGLDQEARNLAHRPPQDIVVQKGDTLSQIAEQHLGQAASIHDIYNYVNEIGQANHIKNTNHIRAGQHLYLPAVSIRDGAADKAATPTETTPAATPTDSTPATTPTDGTPTATPTDGTPAATPTDATPAAKPTDGTPAATPTGPVDTTTPDAGVKTQPGDQPTAQDGTKPVSVADIPPTPVVSAPMASLVEGATDKIVNHTGEVVAAGALGTALAIGSKFMPKSVKTAIGLAGLAYAGYETWMHGSEVAKAGAVAFNPDAYTDDDRAQSNQTFRGIGGTGVDIAAGGLGVGLVGGLGRAGIGYGLGRTAGGMGVKAGVDGVAGAADPVVLNPMPLPDQSIIPPKVGVPGATDRAIPLPGPESPKALTGPETPKALPAPDTSEASTAPEAQRALTGPEPRLALPAPLKKLPAPEAEPEALKNDPDRWAELHKPDTKPEAQPTEQTLEQPADETPAKTGWEELERLAPDRHLSRF